MSSLKEHVEKSMYNIKLNHPQTLLTHRETICQLIFALHNWFDWYFLKKDTGYDYTGMNVLKHREQRHHHEGINEAVQVFTAQFGPEFEQIIREESEAHVKDDMGEIPFADDYKQLGYWREKRGW